MSPRPPAGNPITERLKVSLVPQNPHLDILHLPHMTGYPALRGELPQGWRFRTAYVPTFRTAGVKRAAGRRVDGTWDVTC
jgi:hypothetical protein